MDPRSYIGKTIKGQRVDYIYYGRVIVNQSEDKIIANIKSIGKKIESHFIDIKLSVDRFRKQDQKKLKPGTKIICLFSFDSVMPIEYQIMNKKIYRPFQR